jgi:hypothetical protein
LRQRLFAASIVDVAQRELRATFGEGVCQHAAEALRGAGDQYDLVFEIKHCASPQVVDHNVRLLRIIHLNLHLHLDVRHPPKRCSNDERLSGSRPSAPGAVSLP